MRLIVGGTATRTLVYGAGESEGWPRSTTGSPSPISIQHLTWEVPVDLSRKGSPAITMQWPFPDQGNLAIWLCPVHRCIIIMPIQMEVLRVRRMSAVCFARCDICR